MNAGTAGQGAVEDLGHGMYAFVQLPGTWGLNNSGFIVSSEGALVIDTALTERRARALAEAVDARAGGPARTVVNTHHHGDHTYGNPLFPRATILAHTHSRTSLLTEGLVSTTRFPDVEYGYISIRPASLTFEHPLTYWADDLRVELHPVGFPAHTGGDVYCWVPEHATLFAGDLAWTDTTPLALGGSVTGSLTALETLIALAPTTVVPGHGSVSGVRVLRDAHDYFSWVMELAHASFPAGKTPLEAATKSLPEAFAGWQDAERTVANLHRAYADLDPAREVSAVAAYADMVAWNGGVPLTCLA